MRPLPFVTATIGVVCIVFFLAISTVHGELSWEVLERVGYLPAPRIWDGEYWGLLSSLFVHLAAWHLVFNMYWLWTLGSVMERAVGWFKYLIFVVGTTALTSAAQIGTSGATGHGASGMLYAVFGFMWASRTTTPEFASVVTERTVNLFWMGLIGCIITTWLGVFVVGNGAHVSGLVLGVLVAGCASRQTRVRVAAIGATAALIGASIVPLFWCPWSVYWVGHQAYKAHVARDYDAAIVSYRRYMTLGGDRDWALKNLAYAYHVKHADKELAATLDEIRARSPYLAATLASEFQSEPLRP